jgi:hypothetical protein
LLFISCGEIEKNKVNDPATSTNVSPYDSIQARPLKAIVDEINLAVRDHGAPIKVPFPVYNPDDTLKYWIVNNEPAMIYANLQYPDKAIWPTFFIRDNKVVMVRYRYWDKSEKPFVFERLMYLNDDNKIVHCEERKIDLQPDEMPVSLRLKSFTVCVTPEAELKKDYEAYWKTFQQAVQENQK